MKRLNEESAMMKTSGPALSVAALLAEREAYRLREKEAEEQLKRKQQEELAQFKERLENFQLARGRVYRRSLTGSNAPSTGVKPS